MVVNRRHPRRFAHPTPAHQPATRKDSMDTQCVICGDRMDHCPGHPQYEFQDRWEAHDEGHHEKCHPATECYRQAWVQDVMELAIGCQEVNYESGGVKGIDPELQKQIQNLLHGPQEDDFVAAQHLQRFLIMNDYLDKEEFREIPR